MILFWLFVAMIALMIVYPQQMLSIVLFLISVWVIVSAVDWFNSLNVSWVEVMLGFAVGILMITIYYYFEVFKWQYPDEK